MSFSFPLAPRYVEFDQQGVVFFGHYLTWCDEAFMGYQAHLGLPYAEMIAGGVDVQVVHADLDYAAPVRWGDEVAVLVGNEAVGRTSMTTRFTVRRRGPDDEAWVDAVVVRLVHVCLATDGWVTTAVPERLVAAVSTGGSPGPAADVV